MFGGRYTEALSWDKFVRVFEDQYYPQYYRNQLTTEFYVLMQGTRSVVEYETKLHWLSIFVPEDERTGELLVHRFEDGFPRIFGLFWGWLRIKTCGP